jgi:hypothetical protein
VADRTVTAANGYATAARTALAATHAGTLTLAGRVTEPVGYLDDDGEPVIVLVGDRVLPEGPACLSVPAGRRRRLVLGGRLQPLTGPGHDLVHLLGPHASCFADVLQAGPVQIVRLAVNAIRLEEARATRVVSWFDYAGAEPDLWTAFAPMVAEHLNTEHGDVLASLAANQLPGATVVAASVAGLRRSALTLDVVTPEGAWRLALQLRERVNDPHELCGRLHELTAAGER